MTWYLNNSHYKLIWADSWLLLRDVCITQHNSMTKIRSLGQFFKHGGQVSPPLDLPLGNRFGILSMQDIRASERVSCPLHGQYAGCIHTMTDCQWLNISSSWSHCDISHCCVHICRIIQIMTNYESGSGSAINCLPGSYMNTSGSSATNNIDLLTRPCNIDPDILIHKCQDLSAKQVLILTSSRLT